MATHSSFLAWRTPWTKESDGLQSIRSQRVGHDRSDSAWPLSYKNSEVRWLLQGYKLT